MEPPLCSHKVGILCLSTLCYCKNRRILVSLKIYVPISKEERSCFENRFKIRSGSNAESKPSSELRTTFPIKNGFVCAEYVFSLYLCNASAWLLLMLLADNLQCEQASIGSHKTAAVYLNVLLNVGSLYVCLCYRCARGVQPVRGTLAACTYLSLGAQPAIL